MAPIIVAKNGFKNDFDIKNSLIVRGLGFTSQLFSMAIFFKWLPANLIKENIKSLQCHLNLFNDTKISYICTIKN